MNTLQNTQASSSAKFELQHFLSTPPPNWHGQSNNPAAIAHAALQALRDSGDGRFLFLRTVLEIVGQTRGPSGNGPHDEELLFHSITGCRHVLLSKFTCHSPHFISRVRDYFMVLGHELSFSRTIRLACYNASASFWKRQWNKNMAETSPSTGHPVSSSSNLPSNTSSQPKLPEEQSLLEMIAAQQSILQQPIPNLREKQDLFDYLRDTLLVTPGPLMEAGASYLTCLVGEFAGKSASHYRMALEFHKRAHASFEKDGWLDRSLQIAMKALSQIVAMTQQRHSSAGGTSSAVIATVSDDLEIQVVQVTIDIIGWEFGTDAWDSSGLAHTSSKTMIRPPMAWREVLMEPEFLKAVFHVHALVVRTRPKLGHCLRQLLLLLSSMTGPMFRGGEERKTYATYLLEGALELLSTSTSMTSAEAVESSELLDSLSLVSRLIANFRLSILVELPHLLQSMLQCVASVGRHLLVENLRECQAAHGDVESMEHREWREESLIVLLEGIVLLCSDPWLLFSNSEANKRAAQSALANTLTPLYSEFVTCRTGMARLEEHYLAVHDAELDEVREDIYAVDLEEEMESLANFGRLDLSASLSCLSALFQGLAPQLQALWDGGGNGAGGVTPDAAGLLEELRLVTMYIGHLLTDDNVGETPVIPDSIILACQDNEAVVHHISGAVRTLLQFAQLQASRIATQPSDPRLSPLLAKSLLWFVNRWAPAYILPVDYGVGASSSNGPAKGTSAQPTENGILKAWSSPEAVNEAVSFCITLCLHYHCFWPHERQVQDSAAMLLRSLGKRCRPMRKALVNSPSFVQLIQCHCLTAGIRHSAPPAEFESTIRSKVSSGVVVPSMEMLRGYQRLPYSVKSRILTGLLVGCSEHDDEKGKALLNDCLKAIHDAFSSLVNVLTTKQASPNHVDIKEMTSLCVELYGGVARAGDMVAAERIPQFLSPSLPHLSGLMAFYAEDLSICESLLHLFHDYAEQFIAVLDPQACLVLFQSSASLLKSYSAHHCNASRVVTVTTKGHHDATEEQSYSDILCAIQLLIQLGTKDFIDIGDTGIDSGQVTDMIFFGLQQILPLMTQGLLQFPSLCGQYFSLVGFMMETYPDKVAVLPYELFDALLESLLFGMAHHDAAVAKSSLQGLAGMIREHLQTKSLDQHLASSLSTKNGGVWLLNKVSRRLLRDVVFQNVIWDRLEAAGMALLPLAAVDLQHFAIVVRELTAQVQSLEHQQRLGRAFDALLLPEVMSKVTSRGYEGRQNRIRFKKDFENFCHEIHSFLVIR